MNVIVPIGKPSKRIKSVVHHSLVKISKDEVLIQYQIRTLREVLPDSKIFLFMNEFSSDILDTIRDLNVEVVCGPHPSLSSCINDALWFTGLSETLLIMGDVIFNKASVQYLINKRQTSILVDSKNLFNKSEIGLWHQKGIVQHMSYSLPLKWCHMLYATREFSELFKSSYNQYLLPYEIFNLITQLHPIHVVQNKKAKVLEIDKPKDIRLARQIFG